MAGKNDRVCEIIAKTIIELSDAYHKEFIRNPWSATRLPDEESQVKTMVEIFKKIPPPKKLVDKLVNHYLKQGDSWLDPRSHLTCAVSVAKLGASKPVLEKLALVLAKRGYRHNLKEIRNLLKSPPTSKEIWLMLNEYLKGAVESSETEKELLELSAEYLDFEDDRKFHELLENRRREWANATD